MKHSASKAPTRRLASPKKQVQLNLRRRQLPPPRDNDGEVEIEPKSSFWKWVGIVALFHVLLIAGFSIFYALSPAPPPTPPEVFMSLLPPGEVVKGKPGVQQAPKLGATSTAPASHHAAPPPDPTPPEPVEPPAPPQPVAIKPPPVPKPVEAKPVVIKNDVPAEIPDKPVVKPTPPKPPKVKLDKNDLQLADGPTPTPDPVKHVAKPKHKKPAVKAPTDDSTSPDSDRTASADNSGLSKDEVASQLGKKLEESGVENAVKTGTSGSDHSQANPFADFYLSVRDQVMNKWEHPNLTDETAVNPEVTIHVEKDGRVPPESVTLSRSSGNPAYDDSALAAAKSLGYLLQPLPDGCPPDIHITFKLTH